jgi:hypothetical protein
MQGLLGQYDYGITGLNPVILPARPLYLSQIVTPTATLVAYIEVEAFLLELGSEEPLLGEGPIEEVDTLGVFTTGVFEPGVFVLVAEESSSPSIYAFGVYEDGVYQ